MPSPDPRGFAAAEAETVALPRIEQDTVALPQVEPTPNQTNGSGGRSVARNSAIMALGSIVSRATGFLRTAAIGAAIGAGLVADDYTLANTLPNMVYELLLGGVLGSVIVPVLVRARKSEPDGGEAYAQRLLSLAAVFFGLATVAAVAAAPLLTMFLDNAGSAAADRELTTTLAYLLLPEIFFYGMAALFAAVLNVRGHFAAPMWTPILNNLVVIATAGTFAVLHTGPVDAETLPGIEIAVLGLGTTLGIVVQAAGLLPALRKVGFRWRWRWDFRNLRLRELARLGSWMLLYVAVSQLGVMATLKIARLAGGEDAAGPAIYQYAFLLFMMAHGIVAVSIVTALMPRMSAAAADGRLSDLANHLSMGTRLSACVLVPAAAAYVVLGRQLAVTLFEWGAYEHSAALATGPVIAMAGIALVPYAISQFQTFAFYALSDTRWPALVNIPVVVLRILVNLGFWLVLPAAWVAAALMGGSAISFVVAVVLGYWLLRRRIGPLGLARIGATLVKLLVAAAAAGGLAWATVTIMTSSFGDAKLASIAQLIVGGTVLATGYVAITFVLKVPEIREVWQMVAGRLRRS